MTIDDRQLLIRTRDGHEAAARLLWERHAPRLIAYAGAVVPARVPAEDVVQSVFCRVVALDRATIRGVEDVPAWLTSLVRREALNALRAERRERAKVGRLGRRASLPNGSMSSGRMQSRGAVRERRTDGAVASGGAPEVSSTSLRDAMDSLPRRLREVVALKHLCGLTFDQIALALTMNRNTAAARHRAAIEFLRAILGASGRAAPAVPAEVLHD